MVNQSYSIVNRTKDFVNNNLLYVAICAGLIAFAGVSYYIYDLYYTSVQERAQLAFAQTLQEMRRSEKNSELWQNAELAAKTGYRAYKSSSLAPYFLVLESVASLRQNNNAQSITLLDQALRDMGARSPLYSLFKIKAALLRLDSDDASVQTEGFKMLEALAADNANKNRDEALYYLGDYYENHNDKERSHKAWNELIQKFSVSNDAGVSVWALRAQERLHE